MICPLYTLKPEYRNKKKYIWNINRTSMVLFTKIAFMRIDIQGFIAVEEEYVGETYMNRPVISDRQMEHVADVIVFVSDDVPKERINGILRDRVVYWSKALCFNEELKNERIIIYGTGYGAGQIEERLDRIGTTAELYCVTKREGPARHKGKRLIGASELHYHEECAVVVSVKSEKDRKEILGTLAGFHGKVYVERIIDEVAFLHLNLFQYLDLAVKNQREIYLYGNRTNLALLVEEIFHIYGIKLSR